MLGSILGKVIVPLVILAVLFLLYKRGVLKSMPLPTLGYSYRKGKRTLKATYWQFRDSKVYNFMLKKDEPILFYYTVTVDEGILRLKVRSTDGDLFDHTFTESDEGYVKLVPKTRLHSIVLNGENAKGDCHCEFKREK